MSDRDRDDDDERWRLWWMRATLLRLLLSIAFSMGFLSGVLFEALGAPPALAAPVALLLCGGFWVLLRSPRRPPG